MSDEKPVDAAIRPVLPSRKGTPVPQFDLAAQVDALGADSLLPGYPKTPSNVVHRPRKPKEPGIKKPDARRSAAAREAWKKRRSAVQHHGGKLTPELYRMLGELLELDVEARKVLLKVLGALA